jgi:N-acetylglutamate synthase-like GNAT family acetyltransferase
MVERARLYYVVVYEAESRILAIAGLDMNEIRLLYVSMEHQRRGIGRILLEHLKGMVPCTLFSEIFAYSTESAVDFYKACGFINKGPFTFDLEGEALQTIFMTFPIPNNQFP